MIESRTTRRFWRLFASLPNDAKSEAKQAYRFFRDDPSHPSLFFKKLEGTDDMYSVRIGLDHRALGVKKGSRVVWYWIGKHAEYDRLV
ncbi:MAG: hypothetical protein ABI972_24100 [Acidobacteriota bacterium]